MTLKNTSAAFAGVSGTILQWYDFSLFGYFAPLIAKNFFPHGHVFISLLATFGVFAVGFLLAPLGAIFFGHIGDRYGRKRALTLSIMLMAVPTTLIAMLPTYQSIGLAAPLLLTLCRLVQGFVASAEFAGSAVFMVEHAPKTQRCFWSSLTSSGYSVGMLVGAVVCGFFSSHFWPSWAWRIPFGLAIVGAALVYYLRHRVTETPAFIYQVAKAQQVQRYPFLKSLQANPRAVFSTLGLACFVGIVTFGSYVFMATYLHVVAKLPLARAIFIVSLGLLLDAVTEPLVALLADRVGRYKVIAVGGVLMLIFIVPLFKMLASGDAHLALLAMLALSLLIAIAFCPMNATLTLLFAPEYRFSGFSVAFNVGMTVFGGTTPIVLTALMARFGTLTAPIAYYSIAIIVGLLTLATIRLQQPMIEARAHA